MMMNSRIEDITGNPRGLHITPRGNLVSENTLENSIHEGRRYFYLDYEAIIDEQIVTFLMIPDENYKVHVDMILNSTVLCQVELLLNCTIGDYGTELDIRNHNQEFIFSNPFKSKAYKNSTIINADESVIAKNIINANKKLGASRFDTGEFILAFPYKTAVRVTALEGPGYLSWEFGFSEVAY